MDKVTPGGVIILGFDVRNALPEGSDWTQDRRLKFLLRPDVALPISVDRMVWQALAAKPREENPLFLWNSVREILKLFPEIFIRPKNSCAVIEIGVVVDEDSSVYWHEVMYGYVQFERDKALAITHEEYGYDVADRHLLSGLSNCMLSQQELAAIRDVWTAKINPFGLFSSLDDAIAFRHVIQRLVPEHAPFCVYRIQRIGVKEELHRKGSKGDQNLPGRKICQ